MICLTLNSDGRVLFLRIKYLSFSSATMARTCARKAKPLANKAVNVRRTEMSTTEQQSCRKNYKVKHGHKLAVVGIILSFHMNKCLFS